MHFLISADFVISKAASAVMKGFLKATGTALTGFQKPLR
jgi:hypothetical protein